MKANTVSFVRLASLCVVSFALMIVILVVLRRDDHWVAVAAIGLLAAELTALTLAVLEAEKIRKNRSAKR